jgi:hypothetical protein
MKEEDLIQKLKSVSLPDFEIKSHRSRKKMALLSSDCLQNQRDGSLPALVRAKIEIKGGIDFMLRGLVSRQPVWKFGVAGLIIIVAMGLAIFLPSPAGQAQEVLAAEMALNSPVVQAALNGQEGQVLRVIKVVNTDGVTEFYVVIQADGTTVFPVIVDTLTGDVTMLKFWDASGNMIAVDLSSGQIVSMQRPELTDEDKAEAVSIAMAFPAIQQLVAQGATVTWEYGYSAVALNQADDLHFVKYGVVRITLQGKWSEATIELDAKMVDKFYWPPSDPVSPPTATVTSGISSTFAPLPPDTK